MLNRDKEKNTALLTEALPLYEDEAFSLLDVKAEEAKLELLFSEEVKDFLCLYYEGLTEYRKAQSEPDFREE